MYAQSLAQVGKLVFLVGEGAETGRLKKTLEANDPNNVFYRCVQEIPDNTLRKVKHPANTPKGIMRADWLTKVTERYPEMVVFVFRCSEQEQDIERLEGRLREILKRVNLFVADVLKANDKEEVLLRIVLTVSKAQQNMGLLHEKVGYYLKTYDKDTFVVQEDQLMKEIAKHRGQWMAALDKNYERKYRAMVKRCEAEHSLSRRIGLAFKAAILSEMLGREQKQQYKNLYSAIHYYYGHLCQAGTAFTVGKFLELRELRMLANVTVLRDIKYKISSKTQEIPEVVSRHLDVFKLHNMDPQSVHFFYYFDELHWRAQFIETLLQKVLHSSDVMELLPHVTLAEYINALLTYLHRLATIQPALLEQLQAGRQLKMGGELYLGRSNYPADMSDVDVMASGMADLLGDRKDFIARGIQAISRHRNSGLFRQNEVNFMNIYLIRFNLAEGSFHKIVQTYNEIMGVEVSRSNFFLINQILSEMQPVMEAVDHNSKVLIHGVAALICDYFQSQTQLDVYLAEFVRLVMPKPAQPPSLLDDPTPSASTDSQQGSLFAKELDPDGHMFKLKRSSGICSIGVTINDQLILPDSPYRLHLSLGLHPLLSSQASLLLQLHFNQKGMMVEVPFSGQPEQEVVVEPLAHILHDAVLRLEEVRIVSCGGKVVWLVERSQMVFEKYESTLLYCKIVEPEVWVEGLERVYYLNETACFRLCVGGMEDCKVSSRFEVVEEGDGKTELFMVREEKKDLTNAGIQQELAVGEGAEGENVCWIRCNRLGTKNLRLQLTHVVEKWVKVSWRDKPMHLKSTYSSLRDVHFNVSSLFSITKIFRDALTGSLLDRNIPVSKKVVLSFYIKAHESIEVRELGHHNNPRKIKYFKNIRMSSTHLEPTQVLKLNMLFELAPECLDELELFLTTLFIKWRRPTQPLPTDNIHLDEETKINGGRQRVELTPKQPLPITHKRKAALVLTARNLTQQPLQVHAAMESTDEILRIGEKMKGVQIVPSNSSDITFDVLSTKSGIFEFPAVKAWANGEEINVAVSNFWVYVE